MVGAVGHEQREGYFQLRRNSLQDTNPPPETQNSGGKGRLFGGFKADPGSQDFRSQDPTEKGLTEGSLALYATCHQCIGSKRDRKAEKLSCEKGGGGLE